MNEYGIQPSRRPDLEGQRATSDMVRLMLGDGEATVYGPEGPSIIYLPGAAKGVSDFKAFVPLLSADKADNVSFSTGQSWRGWVRVLPYFVHIGALLKEYAPDRHAEQMKLTGRIVGTPFREFTVNGTGYRSTLHRDKPGPPGNVFSTLGVLRRGEYTGAWLVFPEYGVGIDMQDGDVVLLRAHELHGITPIICDGGKRISVVGTV